MSKQLQIKKNNKNKSVVVSFPPPPKCKDCKLNCKWKFHFTQINSEKVCPIIGEEERVMFAQSTPLTKDNLEFFSVMVISQLRNMVCNEPKEYAILHKCLIEHKKNFYPDITEMETGMKKDMATAIVDKMFGNVIKDGKDSK